jgi:hypothetical protein
MNDITIICQDGYTYKDNRIIDGLYKKMRKQKLCINCKRLNCDDDDEFIFLISGCNNCVAVRGQYKLCNDILCNTYTIAKTMYKCEAGCNRYYCHRHVVACCSCGSKKCRACSNRHDDICEKNKK